MKIKRHHFVTLILTAGTMALALALLFLNQWFAKRVEPQVDVRKIEVATLPPPPPPPPAQQQEVQDTRLTLSLEGDGAAIEVAPLTIEKPKLTLKQPPIKMNMAVDFSNALTIDWQGFGLDQLDSIPRLLTRIKTQYPAQLLRQGITRTTVKLDVYINETGKIKLIGASGQHHNALKNAITTLVKRSRFSPPQKNGQSVAARFIWPVEFSK
ncbi:energy transducer TonB [Psychrobium sp. MM17-31]|uniref:energy transducer TonB n=1 Tax=Psychrobium sp. MM17-31 TaxID=2917758 RepID=UPI001EF65F97|nr:energy transducer TonB [Psychrobium sp. MM17-31]MCG7533163.1 energy transducer TonB [Psychrobium sp. MM17-31]